MVEIRDNVSRLNPFNMQSGSARTTTSSSGSGFEQQLTQALSESLGRLGLGASAVNISIRNGGNSPSARQIVITWDEASAGAVEPASATPTQAPAASLPPVTARGGVSGTPWSVSDSPVDFRDGIPAGGGKVNASGAPVIEMNETPTANQYGYTGLAAHNPYYTNPSNPLRAGYVLGFEKWFNDTTLRGGMNGPMSLNRSYFATEDGAAEALRLVRQYEPEAEIVRADWSSSLFVADNQMFEIRLPDNRSVNAGMLLRSYYNSGYGVTSESESMLQQALGRNG